MVYNLSQSLEIADGINTAGILDGLMERVKSVLLLYRVLPMARNIIAVRDQFFAYCSDVRCVTCGMLTLSRRYFTVHKVQGCKY